MVRQAEHIENCARSDCEIMSRPRRITAWFSEKGVCQLCRLGFGKQYSRVARREHEQDQYGHVDLHERYRDSFEIMTTARHERIVAEQVIKRERARIEQECALLAPTRLKEIGQWLQIPGRATELKAVLLDHAIESGPDPFHLRSSFAVRRAVRIHVNHAQHMLLLKAMKRVFGDDSRAVTAASLCAMYLW